METVVLTVLLIIALALILVVLMQRSEGGGLGMGGGGGAVSSRSAANGLTKLTWILGVGFMAAALALTAITARNAATTSVIDALPGTEQPSAPGSELLPPALGDGPLTPPRVD
jgi:preprotein translocase subunit SecG